MWDRRKIGSSPPSDVDAFSHGAPRSRWTLLSLRYRRRRRQVCQEVKNSVGCSWRVPTSTKKFVRTSAPAGWRRSSSEKSERSVIFPNTLIPRRTLNPPRKKKNAKIPLKKNPEEANRNVGLVWKREACSFFRSIKSLDLTACGDSSWRDTKPTESSKRQQEIVCNLSKNNRIN